MRITKLCFLAFGLNGALDIGRYQSIGLDEVLEQIERRFDRGDILREGFPLSTERIFSCLLAWNH